MSIVIAIIATALVTLALVHRRTLATRIANLIRRPATEPVCERISFVGTDGRLIETYAVLHGDVYLSGSDEWHNGWEVPAHLATVLPFHIEPAPAPAVRERSTRENPFEFGNLPATRPTW